MGIFGSITKARRPPEPEYQVAFEGGLYIGEASVRGKPIARIQAVEQNGGAMMIADLRVQSVANRRRGIGKRLLSDFLDWCRRTGKSEVYGTVTSADMTSQPWLLPSYQKIGFAVRLDDDRQVRTEDRLIVWRP